MTRKIGVFLAGGRDSLISDSITGTGTRHGLESFQQCSKKVKDKTQKGFEKFWKSYRQKTSSGGGLFPS